MQNIISLIFRYFLSLFPACAGVILRSVLLNPVVSAFPRMCGGDPPCTARLSGHKNFSPHVRG